MDNNFVAINYITCSPEYRERFEYLFGSRARAIDALPGFVNMHVLRPDREGEPYLIISYWKDEASFLSWTKSEAFMQGHKRGFEDVAKAKAEGKPAPMKSDFRTYEIIAS